MSKLAKPANIENDAFRSAKWDELTAGRDFSQADAPTLALLVSWYQVIEQCMDDIGANGGVQVAYQNDMGGHEGAAAALDHEAGERGDTGSQQAARHRRQQCTEGHFPRAGVDTRSASYQLGSVPICGLDG
ncbi:MAG: hypothetical protein SOI26_09825 [Coriobacteriales bacterium]|jgi:hypothetical protein